VLLVLVAIAAFGAAVTRPALHAAAAGPAAGATLGVSQSLTSVSQIVGPITAGYLIDHRHLAAYGLTAGAFAAAGVLIGLQRLPAGQPVES
jgi:predicted MFS family arabinose efflux permease